MTIVINCEQGTDEWKQARAGVITASRFSDARSMVGTLTEQQAAYVAAIKAGKPESHALEIAGYKKRPSASGVDRALQGLPVGEPSEVSNAYARLLATERIYGSPLDDTFETWSMRRGRELEPVARSLYEVRFGRVVMEAGITLTDDRLFGYSTDGEVNGDPSGEDGGGEIKCPSATDKVAGVWLDPDPIIAEYIDQCQGGMWINRWKWIDLIIYTPWLASVGRDLFVRRIHRDDDYINALELDLIAFSRRVKAIESALRQPLAEAVAA